MRCDGAGLVDVDEGEVFVSGKKGAERNLDAKAGGPASDGNAGVIVCRADLDGIDSEGVFAQGGEIVSGGREFGYFEILIGGEAGAEVFDGDAGGLVGEGGGELDEGEGEGAGEGDVVGIVGSAVAEGVSARGGGDGSLDDIGPMGCRVESTTRIDDSAGEPGVICLRDA